MLKKTIILCIMLIICYESKAQCYGEGGIDCAELKFSPPTSTNVDFVFDDFRKYVTGQTLSGSTVLKVTADSLVGNPNCQWKLMMYLDNNSGDPGEWESLVAYGNSNSIPPLDLLQVKVYNSCGTPILNNTYQQFDAGQGYELAIIPSGNPVYPNCDGNPVNSVGSYLMDYQEFTFTIDYRITPGYAYRPGAYQLKIRFCLAEVN